MKTSFLVCLTTLPNCLFNKPENQDEDVLQERLEQQQDKFLCKGGLLLDQITHLLSDWILDLLSDRITDLLLDQITDLLSDRITDLVSDRISIQIGVKRQNM